MNIYKTLRKEKGITQIELSKILNVEQATISKWEVGASLPDYPTLIKFASYFNVTIESLISDKEITKLDTFQITDNLTNKENDFGVKRYGENLNNLAINELNEAEKNIIEIYRKLPEQRQLMLCQTAKDYYRVCFGEDKLSKFKVGS